MPGEKRPEWKIQMKFSGRKMRGERNCKFVSWMCCIRIVWFVAFVMIHKLFERKRWGNRIRQKCKDGKSKRDIAFGNWTLYIHHDLLYVYFRIHWRNFFSRRSFCPYSLWAFTYSFALTHTKVQTHTHTHIYPLNVSDVCMNVSSTVTAKCGAPSTSSIIIEKLNVLS